MNLYLLTQSENTGYDTHDSCVVAAVDEAAARYIHPGYSQAWDSYSSTWASKPENVQVTLLGTAVVGTESGVVLASFNAG